MENERVIIPGDIYRHFKNKMYQIITVAYDSETDEKYVVYQALYGDFKKYIRPYDMFISEVDRVKYPQAEQKYRFEHVDLTVKDEKEAYAGCEANPYLLNFLDRDTCNEKIEYVNSIRNHIDDRLIDDMAVAMDITIEDGDLDFKIDSLLSCLRTKARFECGRFR